MSSWLKRQLYRYRHSAVLKAGTWYVAGQILRRGLAVAALPIFAHLLLPEEYGTVAVFFTWVSVMGVVLPLNVQASLVRAKFDNVGVNYDAVVSSVTALGVATSAVMLATISVLPGSWVEGAFGLSHPLLCLAAAVATASVAHTATLQKWIAQVRYRAHQTLCVSVDSAKVLLGVVLVLMLQQDRHLGRIGGVAAVELGVGCVLVGVLWRHGRTLWDRQTWRYALLFSLPLIPHNLCGLLLAHFDRIMVDQIVGRTEAGIYSLGYAVGDGVGLIWMATNAAFKPWFYQQLQRQQHARIRQRCRQYVVTFAAGTIVCMLLGPLVIWLLTPDTYHDAAAIVPVVMAAGFCRLLYGFYAEVSFYNKRTAVISAGTIAATAINIGLNALLLATYGIMAAAWSTLLAYVAVLTFNMIAAKRQMPTHTIFPERWLLTCWVAVIGVGTALALALAGTGVPSP